MISNCAAIILHYPTRRLAALAGAWWGHTPAPSPRLLSPAPLPSWMRCDRGDAGAARPGAAVMVLLSTGRAVFAARQTRFPQGRAWPRGRRSSRTSRILMNNVLMRFTDR